MVKVGLNVNIVNTLCLMHQASNHNFPLTLTKGFECLNITIKMLNDALVAMVENYYYYAPIAAIMLLSECICCCK